MEANCYDWLTCRDERYTLAYVSLRSVATTNESTQIITYLLSSFEYPFMFSSSSFHMKTEQATHQVHQLFSRQNGRYTTHEAAACGCYCTPRGRSATHYHQPTHERPTQVEKRSQGTSHIEKGQGCTERRAKLASMISSRLSSGKIQI